MFLPRFVRRAAWAIAPGLVAFAPAATGQEVPAPPGTAVAPPATAPPATAPPATAPAPAAVPPAPRPAPAPPPVDADAEPTDHSRLVNHVGIGWLGIGDLPLPDAKPGGTFAQPAIVPNDKVVVRTVSAPLLGARIWLRPTIGVDFGLGLAMSRGSTTSQLGVQSLESQKQSIVAMLVQAGVPIAIADVKHMTLVVVPEVRYGHTWSKVKPLYKDNSPPEADLQGQRFDLGARAGAEVYFGFLGLPRLALEGSVGAFFTVEAAKASCGNQSVSDTSMVFTTTSFGNPWDVFRGTIAARYYF